MTLQKTPQDSTFAWQDAPIAWLQPVRLPVDSWSEFARELSDSLDELERRHAPSRPLAGDHDGEVSPVD